MQKCHSDPDASLTIRSQHSTIENGERQALQKLLYGSVGNSYLSKVENGKLDFGDSPSEAFVHLLAGATFAAGDRHLVEDVAGVFCRHDRLGEVFAGRLLSVICHPARHT